MHFSQLSVLNASPGKKETVPGHSTGGCPQLVKVLVIKAEDARILNDMKLMKKMYSSLYEVNRELIGEYIKRANNHNELLSSLKEVNAMIQKAARLRVGAAKTKVLLCLGNRRSRVY